MEHRGYFFILILSVTICANAKPRLYIGGLFSVYHNDTDLETGSKGYHSLVGTQMALEDINRPGSSILSQYELVLLYNDTQVSQKYSNFGTLKCSRFPNVVRGTFILSI